MQQTPAHQFHNPDLIPYMPIAAQKLVEVGCSTGALARAYLAINPHCHYVGLDIDPDYVTEAAKYCAQSLAADVETMDDALFAEIFAADCVVFGDTLEHLRDPWAVLKKIRPLLRENGRIVACIPNAQHWSVQLRLACGLFRYEDSGLLDRTHLRWFSRITALEMFSACGFRVVDGKARVFPEADREKFLPIIESFARAAGFDPQQAATDSLPLQYVFAATPA